MKIKDATNVHEPVQVEPDRDPDHIHYPRLTLGFFTSTGARVKNPIALSFPNYVFPWQNDDSIQYQQKMKSMALLGGGIGGFLGIFESFFVFREIHAFKIAARTVGFSIPMALTGATYATAVHYINEIRGNKNDSLNHMFGGFAAGIPYAFKSASIVKGCGFGLVFALVACTLKDIYLEYDTEEKRMTMFNPGPATMRKLVYPSATPDSKFKHEVY